MQQGSVEVIHYVEKREKHFAFPVLFRKSKFLACAPSVVFKFSQQSDTAFALASQFLIQPHSFMFHGVLTLHFNDLIESVISPSGFIYVFQALHITSSSIDTPVFT